MSVEIQVNGMQQLQKTLQDYLRVSRKTVDEVMAKKGNDLRIQMFKRTREHAFGGSGKRTGIAEREMRQRSAQGQGTLTRFKWLGSRYQNPPVTKTGKALNRQQALVWQEIQRREAGIGLMSVAFLGRRWRENSQGRKLVEIESAQLGLLGQSEQQSFLDRQEPESTFRISGFTPFLRNLTSRYGIKEKAIADVNADMQVYLNRKASDALLKSRLR